MISVNEALSLVLNEAHSFGSEHVPLAKSFSRVLAQNINADRDYPPFNRSAMDGFAVQSANYKAKDQYSIVGTIFAGDPPTPHSREITDKEVFKIMTGAAVPPGYDAVVRKEDAVVNGETVAFSAATVEPWYNIAQQGEDIKQQSVLELKGQRIDQSTVTLLASLGVSHPVVQKLPRIAIITTGNEIVPIDKKPKPTQIRNSNVFALRCLLARFEIHDITEIHTSDDKDLLTTALRTALSYDIVLVTGGVSAGDSDYVPEVLREHEVKQVFHKSAMKPGKPLFFGVRGKTHIFAIPGNPWSCQVVFKVYVAPFLNKCFGMAPPVQMALPLAFDRYKKDSLQHFFPVRVVNRDGGLSELQAIGFNGSGDIRAGVGSDGLAVQEPEQKEIRRGEIIRFLPW